MSRRRKRSRLKGFAEPAHTAKLYIGRDKPGGGHVSDREMSDIAEMATVAAGGGASVQSGEGRWNEPGKRTTKERIATIDIVVSGAVSCSKFIARARAAAARAAGRAEQTAVLVVAHCSDGTIDADLVNRHGRTEYALTTLPVPPKGSDD